MRHYSAPIIIFLAIGLLQIVHSVSAQTATPPTIGNGTEANPYQIATLANLHWISDNPSVWDKHFIQVSHIDASSTIEWNGGEGWIPIGTVFSDNSFQGIYNGNGHTIDGLYINRPDDYNQGLFAYSNMANISNLGLTNCNITGLQYIGGICGQARSTTISCVYVTGTVSGNTSGGISGQVTNSSINNTYTHVVLNTKDSFYSSGLVGSARFSFISDSYSIISGDEFDHRNLLIGSIFYSEVENCFSDTLSISTSTLNDLYTYLEAGWDFKDLGANGLWNIGNNRNNGYPYLNWQFPEDSGPINVLPTIHTLPVFSVTDTTAILQVIITNIGSPRVEKYGFCWSTESNPTIENNSYVEIEEEIVISDTIAFILEHLQPSQSYYFRAYATNSIGTSYGVTLNFNTPTTPQGDGSADNPYRVASIGELIWFSLNQSEWNKSYIQTTNIDASITSSWDDGMGWLPIGTNNNHFTGTYNGNGHIIENLYINRPLRIGVGFWGYTNHAEICSLGIVNASIVGGTKVGSLVGVNNNSNISYSYSSGNVTGWNGVGGLIGENESSMVSNCYSRSNILRVNSNGGLVYSNRSSIIDACYSARDSTKRSGMGLIGTTRGEINNSFWDIETSDITFSYGGYGKTTLEMKDIYTYISEGWDFKGVGEKGIWNIGNGRNDGYPYLNWEYPNDENPRGIFPLIMIDSISNVTKTSATIHLTIEGIGSFSAYQHGVCWNTLGSPTINDSKTEEGEINTPSKVSITINDLVPYTNYYLRAYITNEFGTKYSQGIEFSAFYIPQGQGTEDAPYLIANLENLYWLTNNPSVWDKHFKQINDIDASSTEGWNNGKGWMPIGNSYLNYFSGKYNGNGFAIDGLFMNGEANEYLGFIGYASGAKILNLGITNVSIEAQSYAGAILASGRDSTVIAGCYSSGSISSNQSLGGIAGSISNSRIYNSYSNCTLTGVSYIGGVVGQADYSEIDNCYNTGDINGSIRTIGGIAGMSYSTGIMKCFNTGTIKGNYNIGGIVGVSESAIISNCYNNGSINGDYRIGGIVGYIDYGYLYNCYSNGVIEGESNVSGLVGIYGSLDQVYEFPTGTRINNCYNQSTNNQSFDSIACSSFWDTDSSALNDSDGGTGLKTEDMLNPETYIKAGWDFKGLGIEGIWNIGNGRNNGYPYLSYQFPNDSLSLNIAPTIFTQKVLMVEDNLAEGYAIITCIGNPKATEYGLCWNTSRNPTIDDFSANFSEIPHAGVFRVELRDIKAYTTYYVRSFASSSLETTYGNEIIFTTYSKPDGEGTQYKPYLISNMGHLLWIQENPSQWGREIYFKQTSSIEASKTELWNDGEGWIPIGNSSDNSFAANYSGNEYSINGLFINRPDANFQGLFGYTKDATLSGIRLAECSINGRNYVGGLVGYSENSEVLNSSINGDISGDNYIGGVVGFNRLSQLSRCVSNTNTKGIGLVGGLVGISYSSSIKQCYTNGSVKGQSRIGGLVGYNWKTEVSNCYSSATIKGNYEVGGLVGFNYSHSEISKSYSKGEVSGSYKTGGLVGDNYESLVYGSYWDIITSNQLTSSGGEGKTSNEMRDALIYKNWDFGSIWSISSSQNDGYPYLSWHRFTNTTSNYATIATIYPNPFSSYLSVSNVTDYTDLTLVNLFGVKALAIKIKGEETISFSTESLPSGIYLLILKNSKEQRVVTKIVKK